MTQDQKTDAANLSEAPSRIRAVAYYRLSALEGPENSIAYQRNQIHDWAKKNDVEIIQGFVDGGYLGLDADNRPAFRDLMRWVAKCKAFLYVLCLDATRWGRFRESDRSADLTAACEKYGKKVSYTNDGTSPKERDDAQAEA